jgi:hypothetical protein
MEVGGQFHAPYESSTSGQEVCGPHSHYRCSNQEVTVKIGIEHRQSNLWSVILLTQLLGVRSETRQINTVLGIPAPPHPKSYCMTFCLDIVT